MQTPGVLNQTDTRMIVRLGTCPHLPMQLHITRFLINKDKYNHGSSQKGDRGHRAMTFMVTDSPSRPAAKGFPGCGLFSAKVLLQG